MASQKGGIYFIISLKDDKKYVGRSVDIKRRIREHRNSLIAQRHKNKHLQNAWNKYGETNFIFVPFLFCDEAEAILEEQKQLDALFSQPDKTFNISKDAFLAPSTAEHRRAISEGGKKRAPISEETRAKLKAARARKVFTEEERAKISAASKGRKHTEETKKKLSIASKGRKLTDEHKKKIGEKGKGRVLSEETKRKIAEKATGRKATEETRKKLSIAHKGLPVHENAKKHWFKKRNKKVEEEQT